VNPCLREEHGEIPRRGQCPDFSAVLPDVRADRRAVDVKTALIRCVPISRVVIRMNVAGLGEEPGRDRSQLSSAFT